jgi:hypothetical protein
MIFWRNILPLSLWLKVHKASNELEVRSRATQLTEYFLVTASVVYSSDAKMEAICSSEMSVDFQWTTWHYTSENRTLHNHGFKFNICQVLLKMNYAAAWMNAEHIPIMHSFYAFWTKKYTENSWVLINIAHIETFAIMLSAPKCLHVLSKECFSKTNTHSLE